MVRNQTSKVSSLHVTRSMGFVGYSTATSFSLLVAFLVAMRLSYFSVQGFGFTTPESFIRTRSSIIMHGWFDFNPFKGSGSGDNNDFKDEQWETQQAILRARMNQGLTKEQLMEKYKRKKVESPEKISSKDDSGIGFGADIDGETAKGPTIDIKMPWDK
jgi:hypothetical protein